MKVYSVRDKIGDYVWGRFATREEAEKCALGRRVEEEELPDKLDHGTITLEQVKELFANIEQKRVWVKPTMHPDEVYAGDVEYTTSNHWRIIIFNDCGGFDYVDRVIAPDGSVLKAYGRPHVHGLAEDLGSMSGEYPKDELVDFLRSYDPPKGQERSIWLFGELQRAV